MFQSLGNKAPFVTGVCRGFQTPPFTPTNPPTHQPFLEGICSSSEVDFPECPPAELARFLARKSVSGDVAKAAKLIEAYLEWRRGIAKWPAAPSDLPNPFRFNGFARDGSRLLLLLPCCIDIAFKPELYCQTLVRNLDVEVHGLLFLFGDALCLYSFSVKKLIHVAFP